MAFGEAPPGPSLDGGRFEFVELRLCCSTSFFTKTSSTSTLAVSAAMVFACRVIVSLSFTACARNRSFSVAGSTTKVDHDRDPLSIVNFVARGMIRLLGGVNGYRAP